MKFIASRPDDLAPVAVQLLSHFSAQRIFTLSGDMGAGKTELVRFLVKALQSNDSTTSPTYALVNEYKSPSGPIYHFDFYRIEKEEEALDMGIDAYLQSGHYCFIEWPEKVASLLPTGACAITISRVDGAREIVILNEFH